MEANQFVLTDESGFKTIYKVLFTYKSKVFNKTYVIFTEDKETDEESVDVSAASYEEIDGVGNLYEITSKEEWQEVEKAIASYEEELNKED